MSLVQDKPADDTVTRPIVEQKPFRDAMSQLAAGVNIITSFGSTGKCGFTASAVCSVTDSPPSLLVCMNKKVQACEAIMENRVLCVNTVNGDQEALSMAFAGATKDMDERFSMANWDMLVTGSPVLAGAAASFDCRVTEMRDAGTHLVLFCEVVAVRQTQDSAGLVYFSRKFHKVN